MKFIRVRGRIIPIREKGETVKKFENRVTGRELVTGLATGATAGLFFKRPNITKTLGAVSFGAGFGNTIGRVKQHGLGKGLWEDYKSAWIKGAGTIVGAVGSMTLLSKIQHLRPGIKTGGKVLSKLAGFRR